MKKILLSAVAAAAALSFSQAALAGAVLDKVKKDGVVVCGVNTAAPGFSNADSQGKWTGLDVDYCRALAAAVLGDATKVKFVPLSSPQRFSALQAGEIDVLARNTTWNLTRDASLGAVFVGTIYYDGQGFLVPKKLGVKSVNELNGATICVQSGTSSEPSVADYFKSHNMKYKAVVFDTTEATQGAFLSGRCQVYTTDMSDLAGARTKAANPDDYIILPEVISKEPLGPSVRRGDNEWFQICRWVLNALIEAEEYGITQENVDQVKKTSTNPNVQRLVGSGEDMGKLLGLDKDWSYRIVKQVGNYGESFEKNLGPKTPLALPRGVNNQWTKGGILYAPPVR
ncbi:amino acid ABC transporter substrate-binding protein [Turicimonas muris]|uniref:Amino acid ABC transporter substrate-binding protein n=1 Tax=Turicimonas muris TaxID=1796652 RepID=A0A227KA23_9BURK|nr:amino acid ABC transporter substrate-binding protein [Turicimonas muris]ANU66715.1 amino acid ABC transporter substrate-binding protein [Burkholderiales bacterium YL45]MBS4769519.1 amino acid ABC transporter substrate-binding protein [Burkholderiales bacterium]OXE44154.1 amino acid ABC transporter substrate-binding protein [Turicimonas muris]QQQ97866.1 amino acid ABC transporter substrate-binding protein [Turicimonas muris]